MGLRESDTELQGEVRRGDRRDEGGRLAQRADREVVRRRGPDLRVTPRSGRRARPPPRSCCQHRARADRPTCTRRTPCTAAIVLSFCTDPGDACRRRLRLARLLSDHRQAHGRSTAPSAPSWCCWLITAPGRAAFGFGGAVAARSRIAPLRWLGKGYTSIVRGVPDIVFFLFFVIALDQGLRMDCATRSSAPTGTEPVRQGNDFVVCAAAKLPLSLGAAMGARGLWLRAGGADLRHRLRRLRRQRAVRRDARGAPRAARDRRGLRHEPRARPSGASWCRRCGSMPCRACRTSG